MEAYLKATGADKFAKAFGNASKDVQGLEKSSSRANITVGSLLKTIAGTAAVVGAIRMVTSSLDGAISRVDTLNSFPRVLQMMGFDAADSEEAINRLSDGIDGLPTTLDSVASTTQRLATMTGDLDGAVETTIALNNAFLSSGASSADASRGLEQYVQMLSTGTVDMQSWRSIQETMPVALNRTAEAFGFAGKSAQNDLYDALKDGEITFDEFNDKIIELSNETGGFADMARESSTGIRTSWQNMRTAVVKGLADMINTIDDALGSFGGISGIFDSMKAGIQTTFSWINANIPVAINLFKEVYDTIKPWLPLITSVLAAFITFNTVVGIINGVKNAVAGLRTGIALLNATMLANPVALVIAILAGLAVMFVYLWNTSETFRQKVTEVFQTFLDFVMPIVQTVVDFVMEIWGMLVQWWNENNEQIFTKAQEIWTSIVEVVSMIIQEVVSFVMEIWGTLVTWWNENSELIRKTAETVWNGIQSIVEKVMGYVIPFIEAAMHFLVPFLEDAWNNIKTAIEIAWEAIKTAVDIAINLVLGIIRTVMQLITGDWEGAWETVLATAESIWESIKSFISTAAEAIWSNIKEKFGEVVAVISDSMNDALETVTDIGNSIIDFFAGIDLYESGKAIIQSAIDGIVAMKDKILGVVDGVVGAVRDFWPFSPAKRGPLSDIHRMDFAGPIKQSISRAKRPIEKAVERMIPSVEIPSPNIAGRLPKASVFSGSVNRANHAGTGGDIVQNITINSPTPTSPSENARKMKQASRQLAMEWGG